MTLRKLLAPATSLLLVLTACQGNEDSPPTPDAGVVDAPDGGTSNPGPSTVQGGGHWHHVDPDGGLVLRPRQMQGNLAALIPDGTGGYTERLANTSPDGTTFTIENVPAPYLLRFGPTYAWFSGRTPAALKPDLSYPAIRRHDASAAASGTRLALHVTGLAAWQRGMDDVQMTSPFAGLRYFTLACAPSFTLPASGATSISHVFDWKNDVAANCANDTLLIDGSKGDAVYVTQLVGRMASNSQLLIQELKRGHGTTGLRLTNAQTTTFDAPLEVLPTTSRGFDVRFGAFREAVLQVHPTAALATLSVSVGTLPGLKELGRSSGYPDLAYAQAKDLQVSDQTVTFEYGNPFPATWGSFLEVRTSAQTDYSVPLAGGGTAPAVGVRAGVSVTLELPATQSGPLTLQPLVGPARALQVNGQPATEAPFGVIGTTPLLSWQAPSVGRADFYRVSLYELLVSSTTGKTESRFVSDFFTEDTSLRVPSGVLERSKHYYFRVLATRSSRWNPDRPFLTQFGEGSAIALSSRFSL